MQGPKVWFPMGGVEANCWLAAEGGQRTGDKRQEGPSAKATGGYLIRQERVKGPGCAKARKRTMRCYKRQRKGRWRSGAFCHA